MPFLNRILFVLCFSSNLFAQASYFGATVPLTNTRYGALSGKPLLVSNGNDVFVFVATPHNIRIAQRGEELVARPLLNAADGDVVWNGSRFLIAGRSGHAIVARFANANGEPDGDAFTLVERGATPRLSVDGDGLLLLYEENGVQLQRFTRDGAASGAPVRLVESARDFDAANGRVLLATDAGVKLGETLLSDVKADAVSLAANGDASLAMWSHAGGVDAAMVTNGVAEQSFNIAANGTLPSVSWNGGAYHAAFVADGAMRIAQLNPASRGAQAAALMISAAMEQQLVATASTPDTALMLWNEDGAAHIGLRMRNGTWRERAIARNERGIAAASDGAGFIVVTENNDGWIAWWLDANGAVVRQSSRVNAFRARGVAAANEAVVIGTKDGNVVASLVSRDGIAGDTVLVREGAEDPVIATDGTHFMAAWETSGDAIEATRFDGNTIVVFEADAEDPALAFNGRDYVFVWRGGPYIRARRVGADGVPVDEFVQISRANGDAPQTMRLARVGDDVGLTWFDGRSQLAIIDFTDGWNTHTVRGFDAHATASPHLVALPNGAAFVQSASLDSESHHGSARLALSVAHATLPSSPAAPHASVTSNGSQIRLAWSPAQGVNGYRAEYRVNNGPWLEHEGWADGTADSMVIEARRTGTYQLRLRAVADGGISAPSAPVEIAVTVGGGKRRSVR